MKLGSIVKPQGIASELVAVVAAALIFAYWQRNSPWLRALLSTTPAPSSAYAPNVSPTTGEPVWD